MAVAALALGGLRTWTWREAYRKAARENAVLEKLFRDGQPGWSIVADAESAAHFAALRRKYERAARHPWLPVEPDPPTPE
jgi:hypothetical protein